MRFLILFLATITSLSCSNKPESYIQHIDGYWEINEVILNNGNTRTYNYNDTIDYFELTMLKEYA